MGIVAPGNRGELLTVRETAQQCRVHAETVRRWLRRGLLPAIIVGGGPEAGYRIPKRAVLAYLRGRPMEVQGD